jgi:molecular chaperone GrpE
MPDMNDPNSVAPDEAAPAASPGAAPELDALQKELETLRAQVAESQDRFMRAKAETENVRRRAENDVANAHKYAIERFALEMLAVKDSLERAQALGGQGTGGSLEKMLEGMDLTIKLMESIFQKFALTEVNPAKGDKFDPEKHQAMSAQPSDEVPDNHILLAMQKGYVLNGRLLRPALVMVAKAPGQGA